jgi:hypothetical protein
MGMHPMVVSSSLFLTFDFTNNAYITPVICRCDLMEGPPVWAGRDHL